MSETSSETAAVPSGQCRTPEPTDLIFPKWQREPLKTILEEQNLRFDRDDRHRTAHSLMEGANIYQIAENCRTSVEPIEKYYSAHIKTSLHAAAINVTRPPQAQGAKRAIQAGRGN